MQSRPFENRSFQPEQGQPPVRAVPDAMRRMRRRQGGNLMITIQVCVGSSCFLRGAPDVIKEFEKAIEKYAPRQVELKGTFCQELCTKGVTVRINEKVFTAVAPEDVPKLFKEQVIPMLYHDENVDAGDR